MPEKLLTIKEVAEYLKLSEDEVKRLVDMGEIPAYKIGDSFLRFRKEQIDAIRSEIREFETDSARAATIPSAGPAQAHPYTDLEREIKLKSPVTMQYDYTFAERIRDFFYFHDFYIICFAIIAVLMCIIFKT